MRNGCVFEKREPAILYYSHHPRDRGRCLGQFRHVDADRPVWLFQTEPGGLFVPVIIAKMYFVWIVVTGRIKKWGAMEVEDPEEALKEEKEAGAKTWCQLHPLLYTFSGVENQAIFKIKSVVSDQFNGACECVEFVLQH